MLEWTGLSTSLSIDSQIHNNYQPPSLVMSTAATPINASAPLHLIWDTENITSEYYIFMHFAEVAEIKANQSRSFNITLNGNYFYGPFSPKYLETTTVYSPSFFSAKTFDFSIFKTETSTLPSIINAVEIYSVRDLPYSETDQQEGIFSLILIWCRIYHDKLCIISKV